MNILYCFDKNYEQHFGVSLTSLLINNPEDFNIYIFLDNLNTKLIKKIETIQEQYNVKIITYEIDEKKLANLTLSIHASFANYYRLLLGSILPEKIDKILYLDSDTIVNNSIKNLYELDINEYYLAARGGKAPGQKKRLLLKNNYYFNSGVMLINLTLWRQHKIGEQALEFAKKNPNMLKLWDQDALNKVIDGDFIILDKKWNSLIDLSSGQNENNKETIIMHFVGSLKPWYSWCFNKEKEIYWLYLKKSLWSDSRPQYPKTFKQTISALKYLWLLIKKSSIFN